MKDKATKVSASKAVMQGFDKLYEKVPAFEDVFTETSFYVFAVTLVILSIVLGVLAANTSSLKTMEKRFRRRRNIKLNTLDCDICSVRFSVLLFVVRIN